ncbi:MAG: hypothetical protein ABIK08_02330 [Pseudomonadota bacterium]
MIIAKRLLLSESLRSRSRPWRNISFGPDAHGDEERFSAPVII